MTEFETYSVMLQLASFIVLAIGLYVAIIQLHKINKQRTSEHDWNRRSRAFGYSFSDDPEMLKVLTRLDSHLHVSSSQSSEISYEQIEKLSQSDYKEIKNDIHFALARLEFMCSAMKHAVADEDICKDILKNRVVSFFRFFRQYIEEMRKIRKAPSVMENLEYFASKWSNKEFEIRNKTDE